MLRTDSRRRDGGLMFDVINELDMQLKFFNTVKKRLI